jgi:hypothetical protein
MIERQYIHLFIWKKKGWFVNLLDKCHGDTNITIFMSKIKYM